MRILGKIDPKAHNRHDRLGTSDEESVSIVKDDHLPSYCVLQPVRGVDGPFVR